MAVYRMYAWMTMERPWMKTDEPRMGVMRIAFHRPAIGYFFFKKR
jgi:hypothetical protein